MFLHIGNNYLIRMDSIIGIYNIESLLEDSKGRKFVNELKQNQNVVDISEGKWSSVVLTDETIYVTRISTATLQLRSNEDIGELLMSNKRGHGAASGRDN